MADVKFNFKVTGKSVTTLDYSITNAPDDVIKEIAGYLADADLDKIVKEEPTTTLSGKDKETAQVVLTTNDTMIFNAALPINKIAKIEKKLLHILLLLIDKHSD